MKHIIANLKEHQSLEEAVTWINKFVNTLRSHAQILESLHSGKLQVILAPSTPFLVTFKSAVHEFPHVFLAAQDISAFLQGSYTGETGAHTLKGIVSYVVTGHSERRKYLNETNEIVRIKMQNAQHAGILPIACFRSYEDIIAVDRGLIAYEPADAIGGGHNYSVESVLEFKTHLKLNPGMGYLYGGSVDEQNMRLYLKSPEIDGLLVGGASRDASHFCEMLSAV